MGNMTVNAMRTVQDTIAVKFGLEMGLERENEAFRELARQQRTSSKIARLLVVLFATIRSALCVFGY